MSEFSLKDYIESQSEPRAIALQSGETTKECLSILTQEGIEFSEPSDRQLSFQSSNPECFFQFARGINALPLVRAGMLGALVGEDLFDEWSFKYPDLRIATYYGVENPWYITFASIPGFTTYQLPGTIIATKYPRITSRFIKNLGFWPKRISLDNLKEAQVFPDRQVGVLKVDGKVEGFVQTGSKLPFPINAIMDIVKTGSTIEANGLQEDEKNRIKYGMVFVKRKTQ